MDLVVKVIATIIRVVNSATVVLVAIAIIAVSSIVMLPMTVTQLQILLLIKA